MRISRGGISEALGWVALAIFLAIGVPIFVCMPLWVDTTYHDLSARNLHWGGVHYRDIFETNLPGMVWVHAVVRRFIGWSSEAIRVVDLLVVGACVLLLVKWLVRLGVSRGQRLWYAAAMVLFYVYDTQFIHCQRDMWMLLPALIALTLRGRQLGRTGNPSLRLAMCEGVAWACAVWIKPHCLVPALAVWLVSLRPLIASTSPRLALADFLGLLTGGLLAGGLGSLWLIYTGAWPYMWDVLLNWNGEYYTWTYKEMDARVSMVIMYFAPWSLVHYVALPTAIFALANAKVWRASPVEPMKMGRALLAALYLGWLAQATLLQKGFHYSNAPTLLLAFAVMGSFRWPIAQIFVVWTLAGGLLHYYNDRDQSFLPALTQFEKERPYTAQQLVPRTKLFNRDWKLIWERCLRRGSDPDVKDYLSFYRYNHCTPGWADLDRVRVYLQTLQLKDGDLICWDDSTHPLYLDLNIKPAIRYMHVNTVLDFRSKRNIIRQEVINSKARYVVGDLMIGYYFYEYGPTWEIESDILALPPSFPCICAHVFPWNQTIVFRAGRYVVFKIDQPIGEVRLPYPARMDKP